MTWKPHVTVAVIIEKKINGESQFLLVEEQTKSNAFFVLNQPAGHVEQHETLIEACIRETLEETGYDVEITDLLGIYTYTPPSPEQSADTYYRFCFIGQEVNYRENYPLDQGIIRAIWLTKEELIHTGRARSPLVVRCIEDYQAGKRYPLDFIFEHQYL